MSDDATRHLGYLIIIVYLAVAILEIIFLYIIYKLYLYLREYKLIESGKLDPFNAPGADVYSANWYIAPPNKHAWGGSPDAGDVYPYEAPVV
uniref:Uncharacterized protein n=1 Tax=Acrobeloides nanus TaxID=290746 RepID=A0A914DEJ5_9BILA